MRLTAIGAGTLVLLSASSCTTLQSPCPGRRASVSGITGLTTTGQDSRIDLQWAPTSEADKGFNVYRAPTADGPFRRLNDRVHRPNLYSDFLGENNRTCFYRVTRIDRAGIESAPSPVVSATSRAMTDSDLLSSIQEATFRYFWDWGHPVSGLARERNTSRDVCTTGGTGFGLMAIMVAADRRFVSRQEAAERILKTVTFLQEKAVRYHGAWSHWLNGRTGKTVPFSKFDDGGDLVETSFLIEGMLTVREYFDSPTNSVECELRKRITELWRGVDWNWYLRTPGGRKLYWHWSPRHGWKKNHAIGGHFNECMITYLLAIASPTHPIPAACYYEGWVGDSRRYANGHEYYGLKQWVGWPLGGPLFFTHYSFLGFDPRGKRDRFCSYFENNRNISLIQWAYCRENPNGFEGYSGLGWGLTASDDPDGYLAHAPERRDNGTLTPTAALSAMPYTPRRSLATLKHFYYTYGDRLWGEFGFHDAFNPTRNWFARSYLAIDQGPIVCMIENYRTGLCWRMFMANPEIKPMLDAIGWRCAP